MRGFTCFTSITLPLTLENWYCCPYAAELKSRSFLSSSFSFAGDWTQGLTYLRQEVCHQATCPAIPRSVLFIILHNCRKSVEIIHSKYSARIPNFEWVVAAFINYSYRDIDRTTTTKLQAPSWIIPEAPPVYQVSVWAYPAMFCLRGFLERVWQ